MRFLIAVLLLIPTVLRLEAYVVVGSFRQEAPISHTGYPAPSVSSGLAPNGDLLVQFMDRLRFDDVATLVEAGSDPVPEQERKWSALLANGDVVSIDNPKAGVIRRRTSSGGLVWETPVGIEGIRETTGLVALSTGEVVAAFDVYPQGSGYGDIVLARLGASGAVESQHRIGEPGSVDFLFGMVAIGNEIIIGVRSLSPPPFSKNVRDILVLSREWQVLRRRPLTIGGFENDTLQAFAGDALLITKTSDPYPSLAPNGMEFERIDQALETRWKKRLGPGVYITSRRNTIWWAGTTSGILEIKTLNSSGDVTSDLSFFATGIPRQVHTLEDGRVAIVCLTERYSPPMFSSSGRAEWFSALDVIWLSTRNEDAKPVVRLQNASATDNATYFASQPATVMIALPPGSMDTYYTTDGSEPTRANGFRYTNQFTIFTNATLRAVSYGSNDRASTSEAIQIVTPPDYRVIVQGPSAEWPVYFDVRNDWRNRSIPYGMRNADFELTVTSNSLVVLNGLSSSELWWTGDFVAHTGNATGVRVTNNMVVRGTHLLGSSPAPPAGGEVISEEVANDFVLGAQRLFAIPAPGSRVREDWASALSNPNVRWTNVTPAFEPPRAFEPLPAGELTLTALPSGPGNVLLEPSEASYRAGERVTVKAAPFRDSVFTGWSDSDSRELEREFIVESEAQVRALFTGLSEGHFIVSQRWTSNSVCSLQQSRDLKNWTTVQTASAKDGVVRFAQPMHPDGKRFFRVR